IEDGFINMTFRGVVGSATLAGIEVSYGKETVQEPSIRIVNPRNEATLTQPFKVHFKANHWPIGTGNAHIHKIVNGIDHGEVYSTDPITFDNLPIGTHAIQLVLVN